MDFNLYAFVGGRPIVEIDLDGRESFIGRAVRGIKVLLGGRDEKAAAAGKASGEAARQAANLASVKDAAAGAAESGVAVARAGRKAEVARQKADAESISGSAEFDRILLSPIPDGQEDALPETPGMTSDETVEHFLRFKSARQDGRRRTTIFQNRLGEVRVTGERSARNNNPGNLRSGNRTRRFGQIGVDSEGFAIFPDRQSGQAAQVELINAHASNPNTSILAMVHDYAPASDGNDPVAYAKTIARAVGVSSDTLLGSLSDEQRERLIKAMVSVEGAPDVEVEINF